MEQIQQRVERALEKAESEIREVGAEAFRSGDDSIVGQAQEIVTALKALRANLNGSPSPTAAKRERPVRKEGRAKTRRSGKAAKDKFPKYTVRNGSLIRIGWSKKHKSEYEHKAPKAAFDATINAMAELAQTGSGPITAERIIERVNTLAGSTPSYQVYVVIGLLRKQGCVEQVGRDGYMIPKDIAQRGSDVWKTLVGNNK